MRKRLIIGSLVAILAVTLAGASLYRSVVSVSQPDNPHYVSPSDQPLAPREKEEEPPITPEALLARVNEERAKVGVAPLVIDQNVQKSAQLKADDMVARNYREHFLPEDPSATLTPEMASYINASCSFSSENIAWRRDRSGQTVERAMASWMYSDSHRHAILDLKYTKTGFGIKKDVIVQKFCVTR